MYAAITDDLTTEEVIITEERIEHSNLHDNAYNKYAKFIPDILNDPDFVFRDKKPYTAVLIKSITTENEKHLQLILRLHISKDDPEYKNSILSFWDIGESRRRNYEKNKEIIYKRPEK